jgi:hypothetical protein
MANLWQERGMKARASAVSKTDTWWANLSPVSTTLPIYPRCLSFVLVAENI